MCGAIPTVAKIENGFFILVLVQLGWPMSSITHSLLLRMISKSFWHLLFFLQLKLVLSGKKTLQSWCKQLL